MERRKCRSSFLAWCIEALKPLGRTPAPHHRFVINELQGVADGKYQRLLIAMPPGSAKSFYAKLFVAWIMARGGLNIIGASHTGDYADKISRETQDIIREHSAVLGYRLRRDAVDNWTTDNRGEYKATGIGGSIAGFRADLAVIDDPVRGRQQADSETYRELAWNWYNADLRSRAKPGLKIVLIMTRWHEDDLGGRLLETQTDQWRVVKIPAQAIEDDPLGREPGEWLWDTDPKYPYGAELRQQKAEYDSNGATRDWQSLFQQDPRPAEGTLFKIANIQILDVAPNLVGAQIGSGWDFAATKQIGTRDPDYTARVKLARLPSGLFVVLDAWRDRGGPDEVDNWLLNISTQDRLDTPGVTISIPQDPGQAGKSQNLAFTRLLSGFTVDSSPETGDKATRAAAVISQCNGGNLAIVKGPWNRPFLDELAGFPSGAKDDQVDALSRAFGIVGLGDKPLIFSDDIMKALAQR